MHFINGLYFHAFVSEYSFDWGDKYSPSLGIGQREKKIRRRRVERERQKNLMRKIERKR